MYNNFFTAYQEFWLKATDFTSTTTRSDWWWVQLANLIITIFTLPIFLRTFGFRRIKDFGKDWKWIFINLIPILGWIVWFIWLGFGKSGIGKSKFI